MPVTAGAVRGRAIRKIEFQRGKVWASSDEYGGSVAAWMARPAESNNMRAREEVLHAQDFGVRVLL